MFQLKLAIILQLSGALNSMAGAALALLGWKIALPQGLLLIVIGLSLFLCGRILLIRHYNHLKSTLPSIPKPMPHPAAPVGEKKTAEAAV